MDRLQQAKCGKSPTSAHHFMLPGTGTEVRGPCKYCGTMSRLHQATYGFKWYDKEKQHTQILRKSTKLAGQSGPLPENE